MARRHNDNKRLQARWALSIKDRDKWRCVECNRETGRLEAHHIEQYQDDIKHWALENGETLCKECHHKHHRERFLETLDSDSREWEQYIEELKNDNNYTTSR